MHQKIAGGQRQAAGRHKAGIFKAILRVQRAIDRAALTLEIFGRNQYKLAHLQTDGEVRSVLKLVAHIRPQIRDMPAHAKRLHRTQHPARIELPAMIRVVQIPVRGEIVARNHALFPSCLCLSVMSHVI